MKTMTLRVLNVFRNNGLYQVKAEKGCYKLVREKLSSARYQQLREIFSQLNNNGRYEKEQKKIDRENYNQAMSNAVQNSAH